MTERLVQHELPGISDEPRIVPVPQEKEPGERLIPFSLSRMERVAYYLDNPNAEIVNPKVIALEQHANIMAGIIFHSMYESTGIWRAAQSIQDLSDQRDRPYQYKRRAGLQQTGGNSRDRFLQRISTLSENIPTAKAPHIKALFNFLNDPDLAVTDPHGDIFKPVRREKYFQILDRILKWTYQFAPFTDTPPFDEMDDPRFYGTIPFPNPKAFQELWHQRNMEQVIRKRVDNLFAFHEDEVIHPCSLILHSRSSNLFEPRFICIDPHKEKRIVVFARPDQVIVTSDGQPIVRAYDIKINQPHITNQSEQPHQYEAYFLMHWLTALALQSLPQTPDPKGKPFDVCLEPYAIKPLTKVSFHYLGFEQQPQSPLHMRTDPMRVNVGRILHTTEAGKKIPWREFWQNPNLYKYMETRLKRFLTKIREQEDRLEPVLWH